MKDFHRLAKLGVRLKDSPNGDFMVHNNFKSSLVFELKFKQYLYTILMEFKKSVFKKLNESFS